MTEIISHYWGLADLSHCGMNVGMINGHGFTTDWEGVDCLECLVYKPGAEVERVGLPTPTQVFYFTFGVMYRHEKHPHWAGAHPNGWLEVQAQDEDAARAMVQRFIGNVYAFSYPADRFDPTWHPKGRLALIDSEGRVWQTEGVEPPALLELTNPKRTITVSWETTETFSAEIEIDPDLEFEDEGALDEYLLERIAEGDYESYTSDAYAGCSDRTITNKEEA